MLKLVAASPAAIRGQHFRPNEHVRIKARARSSNVTADGQGTFVVTIRGATRCDLVRIVAVGSAGSYAVLKALPPPMCLPVRSK